MLEAPFQYTPRKLTGIGGTTFQSHSRDPFPRHLVRPTETGPLIAFVSHYPQPLQQTLPLLLAGT